jgi:hypothetical protein
MKAIIKEAFKFDRKRQLLGSTEARGSCYVPQYTPQVRKKWTAAILRNGTADAFTPASN